MSITEHDKFVINAIFNPNYPLDFDDVQSSETTESSNKTGKHTLVKYFNNISFRTSVRS